MSITEEINPIKELVEFVSTLKERPKGVIGVHFYPLAIHLTPERFLEIFKEYKQSEYDHETYKIRYTSELCNTEVFAIAKGD